MNISRYKKRKILYVIKGDPKKETESELMTTQNTIRRLY